MLISHKLVHLGSEQVPPPPPPPPECAVWISVSILLAHVQEGSTAIEAVPLTVPIVHQVV